MCTRINLVGGASCEMHPMPIPPAPPPSPRQNMQKPRFGLLLSQKNTIRNKNTKNNVLHWVLESWPHVYQD